MTVDAAACAAWIAEALPGRAAEPWRVLGRGLWGPTLDLGDGTVLKLVRRAAGIGDGLDIAANEARLLTALAGQRFDGFAIPALVAHGRFGEGSAAATAGYGAWLRLTRVPGMPFDAGRLDALPADRQQAFAADLGRTVARLQQGGAVLAGRSTPPLDERWRALLLGLRHASPNDQDLCDRLRAAIDALPATGRSAFVHGDAHLSNLLVDDGGHICGVVDFAEGGRGFPEIDLAYLHWLPEIAAAARAAYEAAAARRIDARAYRLAGALYALTSAVLAERAGEPVEAAPDRALLQRCMDAIGPG